MQKIFYIVLIFGLSSIAFGAKNRNATFDPKPSSAVPSTGYTPECLLTNIATPNVKSYTAGGQTVLIENIASTAEILIPAGIEIAANCADDFYVFEPNRASNSPPKKSFKMVCERGMFKPVTKGEFCDEKCNIKPLADKGYQVPKNILLPGEQVNLSCPAGQTTRTGPEFEITCTSNGILNYQNPACFDASKACGFPDGIEGIGAGETIHYNSYCQTQGLHPNCARRNVDMFGKAEGSFNTNLGYCGMAGFHEMCPECFIDPQEMYPTSSGVVIANTVSPNPLCDYCSLKGFHRQCALDNHYCQFPGHHPLCNSRSKSITPPIVPKNFSQPKNAKNRNTTTQAKGVADFRTSQNIVLPEGSNLACAGNGFTGLTYVSCVNGLWEDNEIYNTIKGTCKESIIDVQFVYDDLNALIFSAIDNILELEEIIDFCKANPADPGCQASLPDCKYGNKSYKAGEKITLYCPSVNANIRYNCLQMWMFEGFEDQNNPLASYQIVPFERCGSGSQLVPSSNPYGSDSFGSRSYDNKKNMNLAQYKKAKYREKTKELETKK